MRKASLFLGILSLCCISLAGGASGQAMQGNYVAEFGAAFTQATVTKAQRGFAGADLQVGKMLTSNISVGISTGYDVVSMRKIGDVYERMGIIPILAKGKMYFTFAPRMQAHVSLAAGAYQAVPHLESDPIGGIWNSDIKPGGAGGIGFDYWFLGMQGISAEFEYNFFDSGGDSPFSYFALRLSYAIIKM